MTDQTAIRLENAIGLLLLAAALVLPWLGFLAVVRKLRRRSRQARLLGGSLASLAALAASALGLIMTVCAYPGPPGTGAVARAAKARADAVGGLLAASKAATGRFPATLRAMGPSEFSDTILPRFKAVIGDSLEYRPDPAGLGYVLSFTYGGPGQNHCHRADTARTWSCSGYF